MKADDIITGALAGAAIGAIGAAISKGLSPPRFSWSSSFVARNCDNCDFADQSKRILDRLAGRATSVHCKYPGKVQIVDNECWPTEKKTGFCRITRFPPGAEKPIVRIGWEKDLREEFKNLKGEEDEE